MKKLKNKLGDVIKHTEIKLGKTYSFKEKDITDIRETTYVYLAKVTKEYDKYFLVEKYPEESFGKAVTTTVLKAKMIMGFITIHELV